MDSVVVAPIFRARPQPRRGRGAVDNAAKPDGKDSDVPIQLADAIKQLREELREAVVEGQDQELRFIVQTIDLELAVSFDVEAKAGGGFKLLSFLDIAAEGKSKYDSQHKVKLSLVATDKDGRPIQVSSPTVPKGF